MTLLPPRNGFLARARTRRAAGGATRPRHLDGRVAMPGAADRNGARLWPQWVAMLAVCAVLLVATGLLWFQSAGTDDGYITYGAASALAETGSISNYSGDAVEQSSSLLHVALIALLARLTGLDVPLIGWLLGIATGLLCLAALGALHEPGRRLRPHVAMVWLAASGHFAYWALSGMETTLAALVGILWVAAHADYLRSPGVARYGACLLSAAALATVRPEAPLLAVCVLGLTTVLSRVGGPAADWRAPLRLLAGNAGIAAALGVWRLVRFGALFPQPVYAKQGPGSWQQVLEGLAYVTEPASLGLLWLGVFAAGLRILVRVRGGLPLPPAEILAFGFCAGVVGFSIAVGGDWMEGARFLCPAIPLACFLTATSLDVVTTRWMRSALPALVGLTLAAGGLDLARTGSAGVVAWASIRGADAEMIRARPFFERRNRVHLRDVPPMHALTRIVGRIRAAKADRVWVLTGQGGMVLYHVVERYRGDVGVIDRRGLLDRTLTSSPTATAPGRERWGLTRRYDYLFDHLEAIRAESGMPMPDVIYDLHFDEAERRSLAAHGYVAAFEQTGEVVASDPRFPGRPLSARQTIFVHRQFIHALGPLGSTRHAF